MPVFYSERVKYEGRGEQSSSSDSLDAATFPFFFAKEDLDRAYDELQQAAGGPKSAEGGLPIGPKKVLTPS